MPYCVFFRNMIRQLTIGATRKTAVSAVIARNIFTDGLSKKFSVSMLDLSNAGHNRFEPLVFEDNCFYTRRNWEAKQLVNDLTFSALDADFGETRSLMTNPGFAGLADVTETTADVRDIDPSDRMTEIGATSLDRFFAAHPELVERGIGLQPEAFADFHFNLF